MENKYPDSVRSIDIDKICLDSKFGELNFTDVVDSLKQMVVEVVELEDYDFKATLTQYEVNQVEQARGQVLSYISQIQSFSIAQPNSTQIRDSLVKSIQSYYQNSFASQVHPSLLYLRDKVRSSAKSNEAEYRKLAKELQTLVAEVKEEKAKLEKDKVSVEQGRGIVSAKYLSSQFEQQSVGAESEASNWQKWVLWLSVGMVITIIILAIGYVQYTRNIDPSGRIEYAVFSATLIASIFFYLKIVLRNYNITKHISTGNKHRANVAATLEGFLEQATQDQELKAALLKEGSTAIFQSDSTGYLTKDQIEVSTPVKEVINTVMQK